ncbi:MAG TPA: beta-L-arabinofuranosidase domain-containing protein [Armatimonadota bacterium]|jgi:hypothetical protein
MDLTQTLVFAVALLVPAVASSGAVKERVKPVVVLKARPFSLQDVRLLEGPFLRSQELDHKYLLSLEPDRLLRNFRVNAGLPSTAQPLGGWEAPEVEVRGHFVGHYLSACSMMYASTGDSELKRRVDTVVAGLAECQKALGSGYLSAFPESYMERVEARKQVWAPWYTLHKIYAGLQDAYVHCGNRQALKMARAMAEWAARREAKLSDADFQAMLGNEHGGMNETLANLYALTGDKQDLALSQRFNHHAVMDPLSQGKDILTGLHANTQIPKFIGAAREYELTGESWLHDAATNFWNVVVHERSYVIGGHSDGEMFSPKERLSTAFGPSTTETCNTYNMLKLTRHLFQWEPKAEYADYMERALYNHILASQNDETGMMCYYVPLRSGSKKVFGGPLDAFWCCTGTGVENHAKHAESIYFHEGGSTLDVNLFIASELKWREKGLTLRQETRFPEEAATRLRLTCAEPTRLTLKLRHPFWCTAGYAIQVNGKDVPDASTPGSYATVTRTWKTGDLVEVSLPMTLREEGFKDNPRRFALLYGPIVLCAATDSAGTAPDIISEPSRVPSLLAPVAGRPLTFRIPTDLFGRPGDQTPNGSTLTPFYRMRDQHYVVYWDALTQEEWIAKAIRVQDELAQRRALDARTIDSVTIGDEKSERDHSFAGERISTGPLGDSTWRHAVDGGWFSYTLKVRPNTDQDLRLTFWGSDNGRTFDILVDGRKLLTQTLSGAHPNELFDETVPLPKELTADKQTITIRFQAPPTGFAGGLFGLRVVRRVVGLLGR